MHSHLLAECGLKPKFPPSLPLLNPKLFKLLKEIIEENTSLYLFLIWPVILFQLLKKKKLEIAYLPVHFPLISAMHKSMFSYHLKRTVEYEDNWNRSVLLWVALTLWTSDRFCLPKFPMLLSLGYRSFSCKVSYWNSYDRIIRISWLCLLKCICYIPGSNMF